MIFVLRTAGIAFAISLFISPFIINIFKKRGIGQKILSDGPTWHAEKKDTPTIGGVIFILAMVVTVLSFIPGMAAESDWRPLLMLSISLVFGAIGFIDDRAKIKKKENKGITPLQKLLLQIAAAAIFVTAMRHMGYIQPKIIIPFTNVAIEFSWLMYLLVAVFIVVGADNAVNITDGIDGLCTSVTFVVAVFYSAVFLREQSLTALFPLALSGALLGFFFFNKKPAKIFMGDTGSLFLGGAVCAMAFAYGSPLLLVLVGFVYVIETLSDIFQVLYFKKTKGKRLFKMAPLHHHLEIIGWSENKIVFVATVITALMALLCWFA